MIKEKIKKKIFIGSDHGGFDLKSGIILYFQKNGIIYEDLGTYSRESTNYVIYAKKVALEIVENGGFGVLCCTSGIGMSIASNKIPGIRSALCTNKFHAEFARRHNDANIICFGSKVSNLGDAIEMLEIFLNTSFDGGRHQERLNTISEIEHENFNF